MLYLVSYGILCHHDSFSNNTSNELVYKSLSLSLSTFGVLCILTFSCEILSWMTEIWMKVHLVSDSNCNIVSL